MRCARLLVSMAVAALALGGGCAPATDAGGSAERGPPDAAMAAPPMEGTDAAAPTATGGDDAPWASGVEECGNGIDDDGDGLIDEDCAPSLFVGVFAPGGGADLAGGGHVARIEKDLGRPLSVVQTYRSTSALGAARAKQELGEIWKHGAVAHLYFEPLGYSAEQLASIATDPAVLSDLTTSADAVADALVANPHGRLLLSFGAEMNGTWTEWGCKNVSATAFVAVTRKMHDAMTKALSVRAIDARRLRWVYAPNSVSSGGCGSAAAYYPGHDAVDLLGMSAYRSGTDSVDAAVIAPSKTLMTDLAYALAWQRGRFVVLQTGSRTVAGDDRGAWFKTLVERLASESAYAGVIPFDLSDADPSRDWALLDTSNPPVARAGYDAFIGAARKLTPSDAALEGTFDPYFWDVRLGDEAYAEIQALRAAHLTSGCSAAPPLFCPTAAITRADAGALLAGSFQVPAGDVAALLGGPSTASTSVRRDVLASCLAKLMKAKRPAATKDLARLATDALVDPARPATRAEAAAWCVHYARISPAPRP